MKFWTRAIGAILVSVSLGGMSQAAELTVLASQGNLPGLKELGAAFARTSGHKVTSSRKWARRWSSGSPAGPQT